MRKLSILFLALVVVLFFFAGYYLYVLPANKASVDKYGMLILNQLETAIQNRIDGDIDQYSTNLEPYFRDTTKFKRVKQRFLKTFGVDSLKGSKVRRVGAVKGGGVVKVWGRLTDIRNDRLSYTFYYQGDSVNLSLPVSRLMGDLQHSYPGDFYSGFLFLKVQSTLATTLYKSEGIPIGRQIPVDSLLTNSKGGYYPGMTDLRTGGQDYKLFYIPLTRDTLSFALCGIKDAEEYSKALEEVPADFIYPIVIVLLLLVIALPLIKFYTVGRTEAIRMSDMIGVGLSLLGGSMLMTITIIQVILLRDGDARMQVGLDHLSGQLDSSCRQEVQRGFSQLQAVDDARAQSPGHWKGHTNSKDGLSDSSYDVSDSLVAFLNGETGKGMGTGTGTGPFTLPYLNFDRVAWDNQQGLQIVTSSIDTGAPPLYLDVSERGYFKAFNDNTCFRLPGIDTAMVSIEPVLSWTDGAFRVMLARRSACPGAFLTTLSMDLYSVNRTVLPSGYGFCIIDANGLVLVHSEPSRNLVENFIQQSGDGASLKAAMKGRQKLYLSSTELYGKEYGLQLIPIEGMPHYLVVFYDKGYILPVNLRILVFSLICCGITLLSCVFICWLLLWLLIFRKQGKFRPLLFGPMDYLQVVIPMRKYARVYGRAAVLLGGYALFVLLLSAVGHPFSWWVNGIVVVAVLLSPVLLSIALWVIAVRSGRVDDSVTYHLRDYAIAVQTLMIALGVLPGALYTWHAQNQELLQSVKREQLLKANQLENRRSALYEPLKEMNPLLPKDSLYFYWKYHTGIYSLYADSFWLTTSDTIKCDAPFIYENTYFRLSQRFGTINYDPQFVPVLENEARDSMWLWGARTKWNQLDFQYTELPDLRIPGMGESGRTSGLAPPQRVRITSDMPNRYPYLGHLGQSLELLAVVVFLLFGMYLLIRRIATELFLQKWTQGKDSPKQNPAIPHIVEYVKSKTPDGEAMRAEMTRSIVTVRLLPGSDEDKMDEEERSVVSTVCDWGKYFEWLFFRKCDPLEQYLLYHFACTGFLNYKNVKQIDHLIKGGILIQEEGQLRFFSRAFRAYLRMDITEDMLNKKMVRKSDWQRFRIPFLILLTVAAAFLFLTRQEAWERIVALLAALSTALGSVRGIFGRAGGGNEPSEGGGRELEGGGER